jgi:dGTPase
LIVPIKVKNFGFLICLDRRKRLRIYSQVFAQFLYKPISLAAKLKSGDYKSEEDPMKLPVWMCSSPAKSPEKPGPKWDQERNPFLIDYATVIHSNFFRRLSNKTQVFSNPKPDHIRTRLTHSIEVEQITRQLTRCLIKILLENKFAVPQEIAICVEDLAATTALAHDIGHGPFGHTGQVLLDKLCSEFKQSKQMKKVKAIKSPVSFDDNNQSVHMLLSPNAYESLQVSCALVDSIIKKKASPCYKEDRNRLRQVLDATGTQFEYRNPISFLMEAADDIAYLAADLEDCLRISSLRNINKEYKEFLKAALKVPAKSKGGISTNLSDLLKEPFGLQSNSHAAHVSIIKWAIKHVITSLSEAVKKSKSRDLNDLPQILHSYAFSKTISSVKDKGEYNFLYTDNSGDSSGADIKALKSALYRWVLNTESIHRQDVLINKVLSDTWSVLSELTHQNYLKNPAFGLLDEDSKVRLHMAHQSESDEIPIRVVVDFISGMTDRYAVEFWNRLKNPDYLKLAS